MPIYSTIYSRIGGDDDDEVEDETEDNNEDVIKKKQEQLEKEKTALLENHGILEEVRADEGTF